MPGDGGIVGRGVKKDLRGQTTTETGIVLGLHGAQDRVVVVRIAHHPHERVVLGRGPQEGRPTDVDLAEGVRLRDAGAGDGLTEGIQVDRDQVDGRELVFPKFLHVRGHRPPGEDAGVHGRVQGLHSSPHELREAREFPDLRHGDVSAPEGSRRPSGGHDLPPAALKRPAELHDPPLV
jgi:hypothetical protein